MVTVGDVFCSVLILFKGGLTICCVVTVGDVFCGVLILFKGCLTICCVVTVGDVFCSVLILFKGCLTICCVVTVGDVFCGVLILFKGCLTICCVVTVGDVFCGVLILFKGGLTICCVVTVIPLSHALVYLIFPVVLGAFISVFHMPNCTMVLLLNFFAFFCKWMYVLMTVAFTSMLLSYNFVGFFTDCKCEFLSRSHLLQDTCDLVVCYRPT